MVVIAGRALSAEFQEGRKAFQILGRTRKQQGIIR
jgi:hypothetical protein